MKFPVKRTPATVVLLLATWSGLALGSAPAYADVDVANRVVTSFADGTVLQPRANANGAELVFVPRIGKDNATPDTQTFTQRRDPTRTGFSLVFTPSLPGRDLCVDVTGDSQQPRAQLILRFCDGSLSQTWFPVGGTTGPQFYRNSNSGLQFGQLNGKAVQNAFPDRAALPRAEFRAQTNALLSAISPRSFGQGS
ncbi:RICIN domain-containing protein [Phytohabitans sp. LJ34]|uniref:RICIN domain-containing protein n=1 Tax=Phytohabitans sp. LJ34 TaxID=3452217 RepID=UPI003F891B48